MQHRGLRKDLQSRPIPKRQGESVAEGCDGERLDHEWSVEGRNVANPDVPMLGGRKNPD